MHITEMATSTIPDGADRTKSAVAGKLITWADAGDRQCFSLDFDGDRDAAHQRTRSWRKVCSRLGYVLHYKIEPAHKKLLVWATKRA